MPRQYNCCVPVHSIQTATIVMVQPFCLEFLLVLSLQTIPSAFALLIPTQVPTHFGNGQYFEVLVVSSENSIRLSLIMQNPCWCAGDEKRIRCGWGQFIKLLTLSLPRGNQFQISPAASPGILHRPIWITWLFIATQMKDDYTTNSNNLTYIHFSLKGWENVLFELGSECISNQSVPQISQSVQLQSVQLRSCMIDTA